MTYRHFTRTLRTRRALTGRAPFKGVFGTHVRGVFLNRVRGIFAFDRIRNIFDGIHGVFLNRVRGVFDRVCRIFLDRIFSVEHIRSIRLDRIDVLFNRINVRRVLNIFRVALFCVGAAHVADHIFV